MIKNHIIYNCYLDWSFDLERAQGNYLWTTDGRKLIDFTSGWNTANLGWNHPEIAEALISQAKKNTYAPMWTADPVQNEYAALLTGALPAPLNAVGRATSGTEANEMAIKTARAFTGRKRIVGFRETFHGQSFCTLGIGFPGPPVQDFVQLTYPQTYRTDQSPESRLQEFAGELERVLSARDVAAVFTEAGIITGWGSTYVAPPGYLALVRKLTEQYGTLMILDEVGTGFSRCGSLFGLEMDGITPDIVTFAKGISNGAAPIGAMVTRDDIAEATLGKSVLVSTFGWTPLACAAAQRTLEIHQRDKMWEKAKHDGQHTMNRLKKELKGHPNVGDIRGIGMEIGIDFVKDKGTKEQDAQRVEKIVRQAFTRNLHIVCDHQSNIQLMPPLTIERTILNEGLGRLIESINAAG